MRKLFSGATLKRKLTTIILLVCSIVLLLSSLAYFGLEIFSFRRLIVAHQMALAEVMAANAAVLLPFNDRALAHNTLRALSSEPDVQLAYIFDKQNQPLAQYIRKENSAKPAIQGYPRISALEYQQLAEGIQAGEKAVVFNSNNLAVFCPVIAQGQRVGMVYINTDLGAFARWKRLFAGSVLGVFGLSFLLAYLLSRQLQYIISRPILYLVDKMELVTTHEDFTVRATKGTQDEVGALIDGFNNMLQHLQDRDAQLTTYRQHLEDLVCKRTAELRTANEELQGTIAELERTRDAAEQANRTKSRFLANISHELRTPMVGVLSSTELLLNSGLDAEQLGLVETLNNSGEALLDILNDLLDLAKIEAGKLTLENVEFNLLEVIDCPLELLGKVAFGKGLELVCQVAPEISPVLRGDPGRLRQVLFNLLSNAIKFTHAGEVSLQIISEEQWSDQVRLRFEVIDSGIGIEPMDQQRIFESFSQADDSTTRLHGGTGLGLSIVKQLVEIMGGRISLESEPGRGSVFSFSLTFAKGEAVAIPAASGIGKSILIIEKNLTTCEMLRQQLHYTGWTVHLSHRLSEADQKLEEALTHKQPYDLLLIGDVFFQSGTRAFFEILKRTLVSQKTFLVAMGPRNSPIFQDRSFREIIDACAYKPLLPSRLNRLLENVLQENSAQESAETEEPCPPMEIPDRYVGSILVAEDNPTTGKLIHISLTSLGYEVTIVTDGQMALHQVKERSFDLVLMDCQMPVMDGYTAARQLRAQGCVLPIIALTASSRQEDEVRCREAGMDDFLCKPFKHKVLHQLIAKWLARTLSPSVETF